jgi:hypothetical protein
VSEFAEAQALIQQIASEARTSGKTLVFDPEAPPEAEEGGEAAPRSPKGKSAGKPPKAASEDDGNTESESSSEEERDPEASDQDPGEGDAEGDSEESAAAGEVDLEALKAALAAEGGVDLLALAKALGKDPTELGLTQGQAAFLRLEKKKAAETLAKAQSLSERLQRDFGDQVQARKAASEGDLQPAIDFIEATFGMKWNDLNKMVAQLLQGKPIADLEKHRELHQLRKKEAERQAQEKKQAEEQAAAAKVEQAKQWIRTQIKSDKLASPEMEQALKDAGFPSVVDLVFEEMQSGYSQGLTDPKKALEKVRSKLQRQAKALRTAGLVPASSTPKKAPLSTGKPRESAQTGAAGNGRPMTDQELRQAVLKEAGLWR